MTSFAADVSAEEAAFMADSQVLWGADAVHVSQPAAVAALIEPAASEVRSAAR